ncbi:ABC transporter permease [Nocardiopsis sp. TSRI0078]|uniref:EamA family transporter n=1 Tax=unclassified Nocardiopsis TaxID=2649073 RepID=UPI00093C349C|nr:EamA family transporter [Nocardiopsis sp. TSRI0078]OKI23505.1 ABC transporter permease [Nocardiopsis sp. TSRI0078]
MNRGRLALDSLLTALAPAVWGSTYLVTTELLPPDRPLLASAVRALPAGLVLLALTRTLPSGAWWWRAAVLGTLNIGAFFYLLFVAAYLLPGGVAALVMSVQPLLVLALAALLLGDRIRPVHVAATLLGATGVGLLVLGPEAALDPVGVLAGLAASASMATGIVLTKRWGRPPGVGVLAMTGWQLSAGGLLLAPAALLVEGLPGRVTAPNLAGFAYLSVVGALLAYAVWFRGVERLPALAVSFLSLASPLTATALGLLVLGETLTPPQGAGALVAVAAVALVQLTPQRPPADSADRGEPEPEPVPPGRQAVCGEHAGTARG